MKKTKNIIIIIILILIATIGLIFINDKTTNGKLERINYKTIKEKMNKKEDFVLIVSRTDCSHCISYKPKVKQIAQDYNLTIYYIDYDNEKNKDKFLKEFNLDGSTPITLFIKKGKQTSVLNRLEGDLETDKVIERLKKMNFIKYKIYFFYQ